MGREAQRRGRATPRYDPELLERGDTRNVADAYRYWRRDAVAADLAARAHPFHVAIENFGHDHNIGTVVRTANAFGAAGVHIVGRRRWNRRGAMVTDRYLRLHHHDTVVELVAFARRHGLGWWPWTTCPAPGGWRPPRCPGRACSCSGRRVPGCPASRTRRPSLVVSIAQFGSTRSINAGVAAGVAMHAWGPQEHADLSGAW